MKKGFILLLSAFVVACSLSGCGKNKTESSKASSSSVAAEKQKLYDFYLDAAIKTIKSGLKDSESARIQNVSLFPVLTKKLVIGLEPSDIQLAEGDGLVTLVCGEVNAKNSFGGYVGFRRFAWLYDQDLKKIHHHIDSEKEAGEREFLCSTLIDAYKGAPTSYKDVKIFGVD
jgi:hypothetical protein